MTMTQDRSISPGVANAIADRSASFGGTVESLTLIGPSWLWREGVRCVLRARRPELAIESISGLMPDDRSSSPIPGHLVLLDGAMEPEGILRWTRYWRAFAPPARVLLLDADDDVEALLAYIVAGMAGYTLRGEGERELLTVLSDLEHGVARCSPEVTARLFATVVTSENACPLSPRELTVLQHIAEDYSNQQIASMLVVELCTVKHHVHSILRKLEVRHRWEAVRVAARAGWLDPDLAQSLQPPLHPPRFGRTAVALDAEAALPLPRLDPGSAPASTRDHP